MIPHVLTHLVPLQPGVRFGEIDEEMMIRVKDVIGDHGLQER